MKRELMAKRKAKATILLESSLAPSLEKQIKKALMNAFFAVKEKMYERPMPIDE